MLYETVEQYAARTQQSVSSVRRLIAAGKVKVERFGRLVRVVVGTADREQTVEDAGRGPTTDRGGREVLVRG